MTEFVGPAGCNTFHLRSRPMDDVDLADAIIVAALIQSVQFKLSTFDELGQPLRHRSDGDLSEAERLIRQADVLGNPDFDWYGTPALRTLRRLTNTIRRALYDPIPVSDRPRVTAGASASRADGLI